MTIPASESAPNPPTPPRPHHFMHYVELIIMRFFFGLFRLIGPEASARLAGSFCRHVGPLVRSVHRRGEKNLALVYPNMPDKERQKILKDAWQNLGRTTAEFAHLKLFSKEVTQALNGKPARLTIEGIEHLDALLSSSAPRAIFVSAHIGNWELIPNLLHQLGITPGIVYRPTNNKLIDKLIYEQRTTISTSALIPKSNAGLRAMVNCLKKGGSLAMLVDQKLNDGIRSPLLGQPAMTAPSSARLALKFNLPIIPVAAIHTGDARLTIRFDPPLTFTPSNDNAAADTQRLTDLINQHLGTMIERDKGQWLWFHRRWPKELYEQKN